MLRPAIDQHTKVQPRKGIVDMLRPTPSSSNGVDLNSLSKTRVPRIHFKPSNEHGFPIAVFEVFKPFLTCLSLKEWLYSQFNSFLTNEPLLIRIDQLDLEKLSRKNTGSLLLLEDAAQIDYDKGLRICILALLMPHDPRVRFFYSHIPFTSLLRRLAADNCISHTSRTITHAKDKDSHCRVYTWMQESFLDAIRIPDHPDYKNAMALTDYAPFIKDPEEALKRVEYCGEALFGGKDEWRDLSDDRYVFALHPAERTVAGVVGLSCAEYLLVKRTYFKDFMLAVLHNEKKLLVKHAKVRSENAHAKWLEGVYEWKFSKAQKLVVGWRELGLLEENRIRAWIRSGGIFELEDHYEEV